MAAPLAANQSFDDAGPMVITRQSKFNEESEDDFSGSSDVPF
jgi:hypothetical protein